MFSRWFNAFSETKSTLLIGPRRAGKTTLLRAAFPDFTYATLDDLDALDWATRDPKGFVTSLGAAAIIDEIQRCPRLTVAVKYAIDNEGARFAMSGSSTLHLLDAAADSLAGRIAIHSLPTTCFGESEGMPTHDVLTDEAPFPVLKEGLRRLDEALSDGGFPEVAASTSPSARAEILHNYRDSYFVRDLMQMANLENLSGIQAIYANIGRSIGSHLELSHFAREAALSVPTARKYVNTLLQSALSFSMPGYHIGPAKRHIAAAKTYFTDNGIITAMKMRLSEGQVFENFVLSELEKRRKLGLIDAERFYYYKSSAGREIDLLFECGDTLHIIEIKAARAIGRKDTANLREYSARAERPTKACLFYLGQEYGEMDGIRLIPAAALFRGR